MCAHYLWYFLKNRQSFNKWNTIIGVKIKHCRPHRVKGRQKSSTSHRGGIFFYFYLKRNKRQKCCKAILKVLFLLVMCIQWKLLQLFQKKSSCLIHRNMFRLKDETKPHCRCISIISELSMWFITLQIIMSLLVYRCTQDNLLCWLSPLPGWVRPTDHFTDPSKDKVRKGPFLTTPITYCAVITIQQTAKNEHQIFWHEKSTSSVE